jgi:dTDP-glucose pyrophosphorylase
MTQPRLHCADATFISPDASILDAIAVIDAGTVQIALAVDNDRRLLGMLTDGDVRRAILRGVDVASPAADILNRTPITVSPDASSATLARLMSAGRRVLRVPAIDALGRVAGLFMVEDIVPPAPDETPVVLMAGGLGQRLRPYTETVPKPMVPVAGKPILQRIVENFRDQGFTNIIISLRYLADQIIDHFGDGDRFGVRIRYVRETERLGTAGALRLMADKLDRPFLVMNGDLVTTVNFGNLVSYHCDVDAFATMCVREHRIQVPYGVVMQNNGRLTDLREKPILTQYVNAGIYILDPKTLSHVPPGYFDMTSLFEALIAAHPSRTATFPLREYWRDIANPDDLDMVGEELRLRLGETWRLKAV